MNQKEGAQNEKVQRRKNYLLIAKRFQVESREYRRGYRLCSVWYQFDYSTPLSRCQAFYAHWGVSITIAGRLLSTPAHWKTRSCNALIAADLFSVWIPKSPSILRVNRDHRPTRQAAFAGRRLRIPLEQAFCCCLSPTVLPHTPLDTLNECESFRFEC